MKMASSKKAPKIKRLGKLPTLDVVKKRKGGGTLIQSPAVFSDDSEYVYVNSGWGVKVFSIKTGECAKVLETSMSGYGRVLSILMIERRPVIVTLDENNKIYLLDWDPKRTKISKKTEVILPKKYAESIGVDALLVPSQADSSAQDLCIVTQKRSNDYRVLFYNPLTVVHLEHPLNGTKVGFGVGKHLLSFGGPPDFRIMATLISEKSLCVYSLDGTKEKIGLLPGNTTEWCSVRCHPMEVSVAAGDSIGRCILFKNPLLHPKVKTVYHWHTLPCDVIAFTPAGSSLYTGGGEHVLVKWNIENPNVRYFLPRLSAPIVHISVSPDNTLVAVSTLDNGIVLVESNHRVKRVLQQLAWGVLSKQRNLFPAGLTFDPVSRSVVLNSRPGHLQFFCPETETLTSVDVCQQNYLTQERNKVIINTDVTLVALSTGSTWMATIETRKEKKRSLELRLKLWEYQISSKRWALNSVIDSPHSGLVNCLRFQPNSSSSSNNLDHLLITTGEDFKFRLWSPSPIDSVYKKGVIWKCEGAASYKNHKVGPACFSQDGSLLAVAFEHILTLWSSDKIKFRTSLSRFPPHIKQVEFGREVCSHLLVATSKTEVTVWNLLTLCVQWTAKVSPAFLISNPSSNFMAVISNKTKTLYIFNPLNPNAVHVETNLCDKKAKIMGATFAVRESDKRKAPLWLFNSTFCYIDSNQELKSIECADDVESGAVDIAEDEEKPTLFSDLKNVQTLSTVQKNLNNHPRYHQYGVIGTAAVNEFLRAPCHTMAPVSTLCTSLLEAFSLSKKSIKEKQREDRMEVDEDEKELDEGIGNESDSDMEISGSPKPSLQDQPTNPIKKSVGTTPPAPKSKPDDLFFIDLDEEVDNIINS